MSYKSEIEALRTDNAELRRSTRAISHAVATPPKSSRASIPSSSVELETALATAEAERAKLAAALEERESAERKKLESRDAKWQKELAKTIQAKDEESAKNMAELKTDRESRCPVLSMEAPLTTHNRQSLRLRRSSRPRSNTPSCSRRS